MGGGGEGMTHKQEKLELERVRLGTEGVKHRTMEKLVLVGVDDSWGTSTARWVGSGEHPQRIFEI